MVVSGVQGQRSDLGEWAVGAGHVLFLDQNGAVWLFAL